MGTQSKIFITKSVVVLATGDPLLSGIGNTIINNLGKDKVHIIPGISSPQAALSKLCIDTKNTIVLSRHASHADDLSLIKFFKHGVILTSNKTAPKQVIEELFGLIPDSKNWTGYICQCLGMPDEKIFKDNLKNLAENKYLDPNLVIIANPDLQAINSLNNINFGQPDNNFIHDNNMITHSEVRAVTLSKLFLQGSKILWDVGAGYGSIGIEAALLNPLLKVYSIEKNIKRIDHIKNNSKNMGVKTLKIFHGNALEIFKDLPYPDRVFIGGGGKYLEKIFINCFDRLIIGGILTLNTVTIESFI